MQKEILKIKKIKLDKTKLRQISPTKNAFISLASSIISQQIHTNAAKAILEKFKKLFNNKKIQPIDLDSVTDTQLRSCGLSYQKISYIRDLALKFTDGTINTRNFKKMSDEDIRQHLIAVKGIGRWTANMFLIFALNRPDILPTGDLAIVNGFKDVFNLKQKPTEKQMQKLAFPYAGEHTYLSLYLWESQDKKKLKK